MKEIILVDPFTSGHHLSYLRIYTSIFLECGCRVVILCDDIQTVKSALGELLLQYKECLRVLNIFRRTLSNTELYNNKRKGKSRYLVETYSACRNFMEVTKAIKKNRLNKDSLVLLMWLDAFVSKHLPPVILRLIFPYKWAGLYFHPCKINKISGSSKRSRDLQHNIPILNSATLEFVGLFDELAVQKLCDRHNREVFKALPDVAERKVPNLDSKLLKEILQKARGRKIVSLLGSLDSRKNVAGFFELARSCDSEEVYYLCAGNLAKTAFSPDQVDFIYNVYEENKDKIYFYDKHIEDDSIFEALFSLSDVILAVYENFTASSNMISKSAAYRKYIVVSNEFLMSEVVKFYGIGLTVKYGDLEALRQAVQDIIANSGDMEGRFDEYLADHSLLKLKEQLVPLVSVDK